MTAPVIPITLPPVEELPDLSDLDGPARTALIDQFRRYNMQALAGDCSPLTSDHISYALTLIAANAEERAAGKKRRAEPKAERTEGFDSLDEFAAKINDGGGGEQP